MPSILSGATITASPQAWGDAVIVAPESIEGIKNKPVGTGAFTFQNWVQGDRIELSRNPDYWGNQPALEKATFKFISDPTAALMLQLDLK